jgi:DNA-binding transcriptional ArsR family regulator
MTSSENPSNDFNPLPDSVTSDLQSPEDVDAIFECLIGQRRRLLIEYLSETSGPVVVEELAQHISKQGGRRAAGTSRDDRLDEATIALVHNDLPKLDEAEIVEVDHEMKTVQGGDRFSTAASLLEVI